MNPYLNRVTIEDPLQFFGRTRELRRILSRVGSSPPQCVSVVGERRIGKSSLLNALTWTETRRRYGAEQRLTSFVYLDFQRYPQLSLKQFFQILFDRIQEAILEIPGLDSERYFESFLRLAEKLREQGRSLILLFDEFDIVTANGAFGTEFYSFMRSVANNYPVAYVTSSRIELQQLCYSSDIADSPFFNIFSNLYLGAFSEAEAEELIQVPSERSGFSLSGYADQLIRLGGHFPFFLQIACSVYFDALVDEPETAPNEAHLKERFLEEAGPHFSYFWEHLDARSRQVILDLAAGRVVSPERRHVCQKLHRKGYLVRSGENQYRPFSEGLVHFLDDLASEVMSVDRLSDPSSWDRLLTGGRMLNQYRLLEKAGEGGMGVVYLAEDTLLNRKVAIKVCRPELMSNETLRRRSLSEARLAGSLSHPAITSIHELFEHGRQLVLVMEWVSGQNLRQIIGEEGLLEWRTLLGYLIQVCEGLEVAHRNHIVHRDIKSSNLLITDDGRVKVTDFGLAKSVGPARAASSDLTLRGNPLGTLEYMSPEQTRGEELDHRTDLFSLGVVLFEGLTGRLPFHRDSLGDILQAINHDPVPFLGLYGVAEADRLDPTVQRALSKGVDDRFQSAAELRKELKRLLRKRSFLGWLDGES